MRQHLFYLQVAGSIRFYVLYWKYFQILKAEFLFFYCYSNEILALGPQLRPVAVNEILFLLETMEVTQLDAFWKIGKFNIWGQI